MSTTRDLLLREALSIHVQRWHASHLVLGPLGPGLPVAAP